ncbi:DUF1571 domain-containing protein [Vogesella sp. LIG4]|uniref:DUF1571 domain-containing protein n=1 Tax=Vogesella sp. LIG4 TaxID=1192162 RepID=UPI00081FCBD8|nr:DUF1571 domain-containing protein [Vogesella sp. LIG4]SCK27594.1 Outer membrane lipoprotein-sorting protein [Vogesella sp. LIG4]
MLLTLLAVAALAGAPADEADLLAAAMAHFQALDSYRVTLRSASARHAPQRIHYSYRRPGWLRLDFDTPHHGAVLVYDPGSREVRLWPFGLGHFPQLKLAPDNRLIRDPYGHTVDRSHVGVLLENVQRLLQHGSLERAQMAPLGHWQAWPVTVTGGDGQAVDGVHRFQLWLERDHLFPLKVVSYGADGAELETVWMDDVEFDVTLPDDWFQPQRASQ